MLTIALLFTTQVNSAWRQYDDQEFTALTQQGAPILVFVHADWCPTCNRQALILEELFSQEEYKSIRILRVDFDNQKSAVKAFGVRYQSTLILFRGEHEIDRSTADVDKLSIARLLQKAL